MEELDVLLSTSPKDGTPLVGDFNIHLDKPQPADFHTLLASFELKSVNWGIPLSAMDFQVNRHQVKVLTSYFIKLL